MPSLKFWKRRPDAGKAIPIVYGHPPLPLITPQERTLAVQELRRLIETTDAQLTMALSDLHFSEKSERAHIERSHEYARLNGERRIEITNLRARKKALVEATEAI